MLSFANGLQSKKGEEINKANAKDWRDRLFENLPYKAVDTLLVNLPTKLDERTIIEYGLSPS